MKIDINYCRVLPRDLFNEAKLLKCIGRLVLLIGDNMAPKGLQIHYYDDCNPFQTALIEDGHLVIVNIRFMINNERVLFKTAYNSKSNYPLLADKDDVEYEVFDDDGDLTPEFIELCKNE